MHPLTKDDLDQINAALAGIKSAREIIIRAQTAGIDVAKQTEEIDVAEKRLQGIKQGFFPDGKA